MALCKKCGEREQHTFPNGRTVALCSVCGWNALVEFLESPDVGGLTPRAADVCPDCAGKGIVKDGFGVLFECSRCRGSGQRG